MKTGKSLVEMAQELSRIAETKKDYIVPVEKMQAVVKDDRLAIQFENGKVDAYPVNNWSGSQLAQFSDIPKAYFDRISAENPELAAKNVNHALTRIVENAKKTRKPASQLLRLLDGQVRGFLSSRYRILDSHDLLDAVLPIMIESGLQVVSSEITDRKLFIKAVSSTLKGEVKLGDVIQYGIIVTTSDVGNGRLRAEPFLMRPVCTNGLIITTAFGVTHIGRNMAQDDVYELLSDKTKEMDDATFWAMTRDIVKASLKPENFQREIDKLKIAAGEEIKNFDLPEVVELTMKAVGVNGEKKKNSILAALASGNEGAGLTKWGLINSFTRAAQDDAFNYEEGIELERAAGQILELAPNQWRRIADKVAA